MKPTVKMITNAFDGRTPEVRSDLIPASPADGQLALPNYDYQSIDPQKFGLANPTLQNTRWWNAKGYSVNVSLIGMMALNLGRPIPLMRA